MADLYERSTQLSISFCDTIQDLSDFNGVCLIYLPRSDRVPHNTKVALVELSETVGSKSTLIVVGDVVDLVKAHGYLSCASSYQTWIVIRTKEQRNLGDNRLPNKHYGALIHTRYRKALQHCKTRAAYTYCPACERTTKDYGGKKHTFHGFGTIVSDIWEETDEPLHLRFSKFFGIAPYDELKVLDIHATKNENYCAPKVFKKKGSNDPPQSQLVLGDCLEVIRTVDDSCMDFVFVDAPYNLKKRYTSYSDDLESQEYLKWCDLWLYELARVLKPHRTLAVLNLPLWSMRHFSHLETMLEFQNWIVWDAISAPGRNMMPAHYSILCFSKGKARRLPMLSTKSQKAVELGGVPPAFQFLSPLRKGYCLRAGCIKKREDIREPLTDVWYDIHRLKHNSRRVEHPCLLPPALMYRLYSIFTYKNEAILDCFNGAGTSTLTARQLQRNYIGIEIDEEYHKIALARHGEIERGLDPFRKQAKILESKNTTVPRVAQDRSEVSKKQLQLDVRRVSEIVGASPTQDQYAEYGEYPLVLVKERFSRWTDVCAAVRVEGVKERKP